MCKVSVVIPYYNREDTIIRALDSVKEQTYRDYEIVLVDDGSTDSSRDRVNAYANENPSIKIKSLYQENSGPSIARNKGIEEACGEYIAFLDSDDEWLPNKLKIQISIMEENNIDMLGCNYYIKKDNQVKEFVFSKEKLRSIDFRSLLLKHYFATPCVVVKKNVITELGMFPEGQSYMEDSYIFTNVARKYRAYMISDFLVNIYKLPYGEEGLSSKLSEMERYELRNFKRFKEENSSFDIKLNTPLFLSVCIFSILKYIKRTLTVKLRNA